MSVLKCSQCGAVLAELAVGSSVSAGVQDFMYCSASCRDTSIKTKVKPPVKEESKDGR